MKDIQVIPQDQLQVLPSIEREALLALLGRQSSFDLQKEEGLSSGVLRSAMIRLNIRPVPGREGQAVYRAWIGSKLAILVDQPENPDPQSLERVWHAPSDVNAMITALQTLVSIRRESGAPTTLRSEAHPEEQALGFTCLETNSIWILPVAMVERDLAAKTINSPMAASLIVSAKGREALATVLESELLDNPACATAEEMLRRDVDLGKSERIDILASSISERYKARYMSGRRS